MEIDTANNMERFSTGSGADEAVEVHDFEIVSSGQRNQMKNIYIYMLMCIRRLFKASEEKSIRLVEAISSLSRSRN